jgi:hypothetical protein
VGLAADCRDTLARARELFQRGEWEELARLGQCAPDDPADLDYYRGMGLARLTRWAAARAAFESGYAKAPRDKRFPLELAGIAFKRGRTAEARRLLKTALRLDPGDAYANDFLGTVYLLQGNTRAALKYWNRIRKPRVEEIRSAPSPRVDPVLLDRAFTFAPGEVLERTKFDATLARLALMQIFPQRALELAPRQDGTFMLTFRHVERNGWGNGRSDALIGLLRGVPYQTIHPEFHNLRRSALNSVSLVRWDRHKQRLSTSFSGPLKGRPSRRFQVDFDARNEEWDISGALRRPDARPGEFRLQRFEVGTSLQALTAGSSLLSTGIALSGRRIRDRPAGGNGDLFRDSFSFRYAAGLRAPLLALTESRLYLDSTTDFQLGRVLLRDTRPYARLVGGLHLRWSPQAKGADFRTGLRLTGGIARGSVPFDELFSLGLERDNVLQMRGHKGTNAGRKGAGPLGRDFLLANWDLDKIIYSNGFSTVTLGPFLDTGTIRDGDGPFGAGRWLVDAGIQISVTLLGHVALKVSFGRDLRSGRGVVYTTTSSE